MSCIDLVVETPLSRSGRARQIEAMFDVPASEVCRLSWHGEFDVESRPWTVGLFLGPSGSGKSSLLRHVFGEPLRFDWNAASVIDDFDKALSIDLVSRTCQAVGFNTIPAWLRPFRVLSTGEQFRASLARVLLESNDPILMDEFTSVVDRQVAKIGAHAVQKFVRANGKRFVAATCHYDVLDWLQPDWIFEPATMTMTWRSLQRRPELAGVIQRVPYSAWHLFAPYHYLTRDLNRAARCFALFVNGQLASFAGMLHRPHPKVNDIEGCSRLVTLPDWQGLGLAPRLIDILSAAYKSVGKRVHTYPAHPALIRSFAKSPLWKCVKKSGDFSSRQGKTGAKECGSFGGRPCAVFEYCGDACADRDAAQRLIAGLPTDQRDTICSPAS